MLQTSAREDSFLCWADKSENIVISILLKIELG